MTIAVIMSVYKSDNHLYFREAVQSIINQSVDCDCFIFQDGLVGYELNLELDYFSTFENITIIRNSVNIGLARSLNKLIEYVLNFDYEFIARMDSDDISYKERLEKQVCFLKNNNDIDICGTFCREFGSDFALEKKELPIYHHELLDFSIYRCPFIHPTVMFRSEVFKNGYRYPIDTTLTEDMAFWLELLYSKIKIANLPEILLDYRINISTIKRRNGLKKVLSEISIRKEYMKKLNNRSFLNYIRIYSRLFFYFLPDFFMKFAYKHLRS